MLPRVAVLVEGESDRAAVRALAGRLGRDLEAEGARLVVLDGITNTRAVARRLGPLGAGLRLAGLYDAPEEHKVRIGLADAGLTRALTSPLASLGFHGCERDLEDELIRALGADRVEAVIAAAGESASLRALAQMPAQRFWSREQVLHRFVGVRSGRKARYATLLIDALPAGTAPPPLTALLAHLAALA